MIIGGWRGPAWRVLDADPHHTGTVRHLIQSAITRHDCCITRQLGGAVDPDDAAIVISELFTNALMHGPAGGRVLVGYCLWREGARLVVCDGGGPGTPQLLDTETQAEGGRGLRIVNALTARWGFFSLPGARVVWCDFGAPLHAAPSDAWAWLHRVLSQSSLSVPDCPAFIISTGTPAIAGAR